MSDTTHPESPPRTEVPLVSEQRPTISNAAPPSSATAQSDLGEFPEDILNEWRWIMAARDRDDFEPYRGQHVAVYQQKIWGRSLDAELLREHLALKYHIDPEKLVIVYIDR